MKNIFYIAGITALILWAMLVIGMQQTIYTTIAAVALSGAVLWATKAS